MTHDEMIAVIAAHRDGKAIQYRITDEPDGYWSDAKHSGFNFWALDYRIKPEPPKPREFWIMPGSKEYSLSPQIETSKPFNDRFIHVIEVLPTTGEEEKNG